MPGNEQNFQREVFMDAVTIKVWLTIVPKVEHEYTQLRVQKVLLFTSQRIHKSSRSKLCYMYSDSMEPYMHSESMLIL